MIGILSGNKETVDTHRAALDKEIKSIELNNDTLFIGFVDGTGIKIWDNGQSCCDARDAPLILGSQSRSYHPYGSVPSSRRPVR